MAYLELVDYVPPARIAGVQTGERAAQAAS
jgi:hypothetical protein